jgi:TetR/AcrR family transcriptional regulator, transcriptional repressor for nem operon
VAGTKRFEPSEALDRAVRVFWEHGFEGASYSELTTATGLNKSSLYNAFGDKQALYIKCLERFSETVGAPEMAILDRPDFADAIAGCFEAMVRRMNDGTSPRGCLMAMAALELGGTDGAIGMIIRANLQQWATALRARCDRAARDGELPPDTDTEALAALFLAVMRGLPALNRGLGDLSASALAVKALLQMLTAAPRL